MFKLITVRLFWFHIYLEVIPILVFRQKVVPASYSSEASFHFSMISLFSPFLKDIFSFMEVLVLNGNMLSSANFTGT